jgi:hypothetical protein
VNDDRWRNISLVLGLICVVLIIAAGLLVVTGKNQTPTQAPLPSDTSGSTLESPTIGDTFSLPPTLGPSASPTASPTPAPTQSAPTAVINFTGMTLDAGSTTGATARTFTFISDGIGAVGMQITKSSGGTVKFCAKVDTSAFSCKSGGNPGFPKASADTPHSVWTVTIIGSGTDTPTVDVRFSWPTAAAKITLSHGRLQGSSTQGVPEGLNGFTATFQPRSSGDVNLQASWTSITTDVQVTLADVSVPPAVNVDQQTFNGVGFLAPAYTHGLDQGKSYQISLRNTAADSNRPDLTAQINFRNQLGLAPAPRQPKP